MALAHIKQLHWWLWLTLSYGVVALPLFAATKDMQVVQVEGGAWLLEGNSKAAATRLALGQVVVAGSKVKTDKESALTLQMADGSTLQIGAQTTLMLSAHARPSGMWSVLLTVGQVLAKVVGKAKAKQEPIFQITTANAVCGVRGTIFQTEVRDDGAVLVDVKEGLVALQGSQAELDVGPATSGQATRLGVERQAAPLAQAQRQAWRQQSIANLEQEAGLIAKEMASSIREQAARIAQWRAKQQQASDRWLKLTAQEREQSEGQQQRLLLEQANRALADLGDKIQVGSQFVDHLADLASNPMFRGLPRQALAAEANALRAVAADMDRMVREGMAMSLEALEQQLEDSRRGKRKTLQFDRGSSKDDLFR